LAAAEALRARVAVAADFFRAATGRPAGLATVLVGEDPASAVYIRAKNKAVDEAGIDPSGIYITNAVKHFRFEQRGKARIHKKPGRTCS